MKETSPIEQMPVIMLLVSIIVLFALSYLVTNAYLKGSRDVTFEIKSDSLDKQYLFWLGIIVPIGIFFYLEYFVFLSNEISFNSTGFITFFDESKLPLGVLALSPIFGVIVSNIHKSIQTEKQIQQSEIKGRIDSFNAHYKFITDRIGEIKERKMKSDENIKEYHLFHTSNLSFLYKYAFPKSTLKLGYNNESVSRKYIEALKDKINKVASVGVLSLDEIKLIRNKLIEIKKESEKRGEEMESEMGDEKKNKELKVVTDIVFNEERRTALNNLFLMIGVGKNKDNFIDFLDSNNNIKRYTRIVKEYSNIYLKLTSYTRTLLVELEVRNGNKIVNPYIKVVEEINENQRKNLDELKKILKEKKDRKNKLHPEE